MEGNPICLACGDRSGDFVKKEDNDETWQLVERFCKLLGVTWDEGTEPRDDGNILFCGACETRLHVIFEVEEKLISLQEDLDNKIEEWKNFLEESEENFGDTYVKRKVYWTIRRQIRSTTRKPYFHDNNQNEDVFSSRKKFNRQGRHISREEDIPCKFKETVSNLPHDGNDSGISHPKNRKKRIFADKTEDPGYLHDNKSSCANEANEDFQSTNSHEEEDAATEAIKKVGHTSVTEDPLTGNLTILGLTFEKIAEKTYRCLECVGTKTLTRSKNVFKNKLGAAFHARKAKHSKPVYFCVVCGKPYESRKNLKHHKITHLSELEKAELVAKGIKVPPSKLTTPKRYRHQCDQCGLNCDSITVLTRHMYSKHPNPERDTELTDKYKTVCTDCGLVLNTNYIKIHRRTQHPSVFDTTKFWCSICARPFKTLQVFKDHKIKIHQEQKPWKCNVCSKAFPTQKQLTSHSGTHLNLRPFKCDLCPAAFPRKAHMQRHFKIYHAEGANPKRSSYQKKAKETK